MNSKKVLLDSNLRESFLFYIMHELISLYKHFNIDSKCNEIAGIVISVFNNKDELDIKHLSFCSSKANECSVLFHGLLSNCV